ncbi:unnamed protein product [Rotaria sp. Silwood2]|nr:unnamed protein product [Rotaria sp. Silwood2]
MNEPLDSDLSNEESAVNTGHIWSLCLLAARARVKILQRS